MRNALWLLVVIVLGMPACGDMRDEAEREAAPDVAARGDADDTGRNARDRAEDARTPIDQSNDERELELTRQIRQQIMEGDFSTDAENVKVITDEGVVTLRGAVESDGERNAIVEIARRSSSGLGFRVDDQLEVARN